MALHPTAELISAAPARGAWPTPQIPPTSVRRGLELAEVAEEGWVSGTYI